MLYGLVGASRAGKTTLAKKVAEELAIDFHPTRTSGVALDHGYDLMAPMTLSDRVTVQNILLDNHIKEIEALPRPLVIDRTPIDYLGYLLAEINMTSALAADPVTLEKAYDYINRCKSATARYYDFLYYLDPLPDYEAAEGKHASNRAYQYHTAALMRGILHDMDGDVNVAFLNLQDLEVRTEFMAEHMVKRLNEIEDLKRASHLH